MPAARLRHLDAPVLQRMLSPAMMTLIAAAITAAYVYSPVSLAPQIPGTGKPQVFTGDLKRQISALF
jgi:hypothetical protein